MIANDRQGTLVSKIGDGGYAGIWKMKNQDGEFAVKIVKDDTEEFGESILREMVLLRNLNHPNIIHVSYYRLGIYDEIVMPLFSASLHDLITKGRFKGGGYIAKFRQ